MSFHLRLLLADGLFERSDNIVTVLVRPPETLQTGNPSASMSRRLRVVHLVAWIRLNFVRSARSIKRIHSINQARGVVYNDYTFIHVRVYLRCNVAPVHIFAFLCDDKYGRVSTDTWDSNQCCEAMVLMQFPWNEQKTTLKTSAAVPRPHRKKHSLSEMSIAYNK
jgi:hypothetical protein